MGDRVTVLKQGRVVGRLEPEVLRTRTADELQERIVALMFGEEGGAPGESAAAPPRSRPGEAVPAELLEHVKGRRPRRDLPSEPLLVLEDVSVTPGPGEIGVHGVSLGVRPGEILGVAGVDGNGQRELAEAIAGQRVVSGGEIRLGAASLRKLSVAQRERIGLRYVTDDRLGEGTVASLGVGVNMVLKRIGQRPYWRRGRIQPEAIDATARDLVRRFDVRTAGTEARVGTLSGGNVQKVVLARELSFDPKVVIYNKPTYGLDIRTTQAVRRRVREQADEGVTSLVISTDLEELLDLCDRIAVIFRGRITGIVENGPGAEREIGELMVGGRAAA
jgi:simple sugar transport system ATP-binding protein